MKNSIAGLTLHTALVIQNNEVVCDAGGPVKGDNEGNYVGWIVLAGDRWHPLLNTTPDYSTAEAAKKAMENLVIEIRKLDLTKEIDELSSMFERCAKGV